MRIFRLKHTSALAVAALVIAACKSASPSQYTSPRIIGRVVDAQTRQPIRGVQVRRLTPEEPNVAQSIKGAQVIETSASVRTGSDGAFELTSERNLSLFQRLGWYSVSISLAHPGYERLTTEFTLANATNTPTGEPLVQAGDIPLQKRPN